MKISIKCADEAAGMIEVNWTEFTTREQVERFQRSLSIAADALWPRPSFKELYEQATNDAVPMPPQGPKVDGASN